MVVHQHHQNIQRHRQKNQMSTQDIMFKKKLQIPDAPNIPYLTSFSTTLASNVTPSPTHEQLHRNLLTQNESKNNFFPHRKYLMSRIKMMNQIVY